MDGVYNYALKILADTGCDQYTYGGEFAQYVLDDLKTAFPDGMRFPYLEVANAILSVSRPKPIYKAPYRMVWETDCDVDGVDCESFEEAKARAEDTLVEWEADECYYWKGEPNKEQKESWDYMVWNCGVRVDKYNPDTDTYDEFWVPNSEELEQIGWKLLDP